MYDPYDYKPFKNCPRCGAIRTLQAIGFYDRCVNCGYVASREQYKPIQIDSTALMSQYIDMIARQKAEMKALEKKYIILERLYRRVMEKLSSTMNSASNFVREETEKEAEVWTPSNKECYNKPSGVPITHAETLKETESN